MGISGNPNSDGSTTFECKWHCYNDSIFLVEGSVLAYQPTQKNFVRGQIIAENVYEDLGLCQATVVQFDVDAFDIIQCTAFNTTRTILVNASIGECLVLHWPYINYSCMTFYRYSSL